MKRTSRTISWPRRLAYASVLALIGAGTAGADEVADLYRRLQANPQSLALNLEYAEAAEKAGKLKWALPAYERALVADHGNREARQGIDRIRDRLRAEAGE